MPFKVKLVRTPAFITCNTKSEGEGGERERRERSEGRWGGREEERGGLVHVM